MKISAIIVIMSLALSLSANSQPGSIEGVILDAQTKESVIGAYITVEETNAGTATDLDGLFVLRLPPGNYTLNISSIGYEPVKIENVEIGAGIKTTVNAVLNSSSLMLSEIVVTEARRTNTEAAALIEIRQARQVVSAISAQQIAKSQDENAAQVMQRVPGVTIIENRFVMIRGLSERYNNVMINNVIAPSTEVDKRTFSFDLVSSGVLDNMVIYKSGSADNPGDFAGGVIKITTTNSVGDRFTRFNFGLGYRPNTTFRPYFQTNGSPTDFLGFDSGFRKLPSNFPGTHTIQNSPRNSEIRLNAVHTLTNNFNPIEYTATPDYSFGFNIGRKFDLGYGRDLSMVNSISYSNSYQYSERNFFRYFEWVERDAPIIERFRYVDDIYTRNNRITVLSNWRLRLSDNTTMIFKNLLNVLGENRTVLRNGFDFIQRPDDDLKTYYQGYNSRLIYTGQFQIDRNHSHLTSTRWIFGGSFLNESEPDLRRFRTFKPKSSPEGENFTVQLPPSSNLFETGRYFGNLNEFTLNHGFDYVKRFSADESRAIILKAGYYADYRDRSFNSRYFSYLYPGFFNPDTLQILNKKDLSELFSHENIRLQDGFVMEEGTRPIDSYTASNSLGAAYASIEVPSRYFNLVGGLRSEFNYMTMFSADDISSVEVKNPTFSLLPFVNIGYKINSKNILRLAYGRTLNRPEFRELAPFLYYDYNMEAAVFGNPELKSATIDNLDLRYEIYPRVGELFSIGLFYKDFTNAIENKTIISAEQPSFTFVNADKAHNYGVEIELRKSLRGMTWSPFIDRFSINTNASWIFSEIDLGDKAIAEDRIRPLQGQSPYIFNTSLYYQDEAGLSIAVAYNIFGDRIYSVGDVLFPTIYELPRHSLDLTLSKEFGNRFTAKIGFKDLLNSPYRFYQDSDRDGIITSRDHEVYSFRRGTSFSLSVSYDLH